MNKRIVKLFDLIEHIKRYFSIMPYLPIIQWAEKNIDFSDDISALRNKLDFNMFPYQVPILKEWLNLKKLIKTITVVAPEQLGKTNIFVVGLLYNMVYNPCQSLVVYKEDDLSVQTNQTKFLPLMKHIPVLKQELLKPRSFTRDSYRFSNLISYFQGAGSKIVSKSCKIVVGDEVDAWPTINGVDNVADLKKRTRSYNNSICFLISSPTTLKGKIWKNFMKGSQGYWYLRCKGCNKLTMRSCDIHNLQFDCDLILSIKEKIVKPETIRLICPECKHEHVLADKRWMNIHGGFVHLVPERLEANPSFQFGALASQLLSMSWLRIANAQLEAGKRNDLDSHITFDNSIRGLPYHERLYTKEDLLKIREHEWTVKEAPKQELIEMVYVTADTQDNRSVVGVWAFDVNDNLYLLKACEPTFLMLDDDKRNLINMNLKKLSLLNGTKFVPVETVLDILNAEYLVLNGVGIKPMFIVLDRRGHRAVDVDYFVKTHDNAIAWLGSKLQSIHYRPSDSIYKGVLTNAIHYQCEAIWYLHTQKKRNEDYLFLYPLIEQRIIDQLAACKPNEHVNFGHMPQNWTFGNQPHDFFDVTKMAYFARLYAIDNLMKTRFRFCKSPRLLRRFETQLKKETLKVQLDIKKKSWFLV